MLFIVEDAHWIDPTTLDLMTRIISRIRQMRVLLLITCRPDFKPVWSEYSHVTSLTLSRLPRRQSAEIVAAMTGGKAFAVRGATGDSGEGRWRAAVLWEH